jgi:hypothetical protein
MSTWICRLRLNTASAAVVAAVALSGCAVAPPKITVAGKSVVIAGPAGYCVEPSASRDTGDGAFVLMGSCASISNNVRAPAPKLPALLTASVSSASFSQIATSQNRLEIFFRSPAGRAALARDGMAASVRILGTRKTTDVFFVHLRDTSRNLVAGLSQDYWRALFDVSGRLVTISVLGFERSPLSDAQGQLTLADFARRIRSENILPKDGDAG